MIVRIFKPLQASGSRAALPGGLQMPRAFFPAGRHVRGVSSVNPAPGALSFQETI